MSNAFRAIIACVLAATASSCAFVTFDELETKVSLQEKQAYYEKEKIEINFSLGVEKSSVERLVSLKEDGQRVDARLEWKDNCCLAQSLEGFKKGCKYTFALQGDVYAQSGAKFPVNLYREFIFGSEADIFLLKGVEEKKNFRGDIESLAYSFNKPVDPAIFEREFSISPYIETKKEYSNDFSCVEVSPSGKWKANNFYSWKIDKVFSKDGTKIFKECKGSFLGAKKEKEPELIGACPAIGDTFLENLGLDDLLERQSFGLIFDCEMDEESVKRGVSLTPSAQGFWRSVDPCRYVFTPYNNYQIQKEYRLCISDTVEDAWGINFKGEKIIYFTLNSDFIKIDKLIANTKEIEEGKENKIDIEEDAPLYIKIFFSKNLSEKALLEIKNSVKFEGLFPYSLQNPRLAVVKTPSQNCAEFCYSNLSAALDGNECLYKFTVRGGENFVFDRQGEFLKEDQCFYISLKKKN